MTRKSKSPAKLAMLTLLVTIPASVGLFHRLKPISNSYSIASPMYKTDHFDFLYDLTYEDQTGKVKSDQEIMKSVFQLIDDSENYIVLDMFLFNNDYDHKSQSFPELSQELTNRLVQKKKESNIPIYVITDPINSFYGTYTPDHLQQLKDAGIVVVETNLKSLRDSNPVWAGYYRTYLTWFGQSSDGYLPNALSPQGPKVNVLSYFQLLNFKANHRKTITNENASLVTSANPHDGSYYHSNIAFKIEGALTQALLKSEISVLKEAHVDTAELEAIVNQVKATETKASGPFEIGLFSEGKIKDQLLKTIRSTAKGDKLHIGVFYLSDRDIIEALKEAANRDVPIRLILDINQDAFGKKKIGIPNRPVASELTEASSNIQIRWYLSHGEQFHSKMLIKEGPGSVSVIGGSANYTQRNLEDLNLETDVLINGPKDSPEMKEILAYYERVWSNQEGTYTTDYNRFAEDSWWKTAIYRFQEWSGLSTF